MKNLEQIQEENRKAIILANNPEAKSYEEALEMELDLSCIISRYDIGVWGHLATKFYYKLDSFRRNKDTGNHDFIFINYGFQNLGEGWVDEDIDYTIIEKQKLIKELTYTQPEYRGQVQTKIIGKPLTLNRVLMCIRKANHNIKFVGGDYTNEMIFVLYDDENCSSIEADWDLTKPTLEEQTEDCQREINKLLTND